MLRKASKIWSKRPKIKIQRLVCWESENNWNRRNAEVELGFSSGETPFHRHSRRLYIQQQSSSSSSTRRRPEFPGRNVVFNKTIAGRRRTLLLETSLLTEKCFFIELALGVFGRACTTLVKEKQTAVTIIRSQSDHIQLR